MWHLSFLSLMNGQHSAVFLFVVSFFCDRVSVENAYIDEKEDACSALGELALNTGYGLYSVHTSTLEMSSCLLCITHSMVSASVLLANKLSSL